MKNKIVYIVMLALILGSMDLYGSVHSLPSAMETSAMQLNYDTKNTSHTYGNANNDVRYRFEVVQGGVYVINHAGSALENTTLYIVNYGPTGTGSPKQVGSSSDSSTATSTRPTWDDYANNAALIERDVAVIKAQQAFLCINLSEGVYEVISEGGATGSTSNNGVIRLNIHSYVGGAMAEDPAAMGAIDSPFDYTAMMEYNSGTMGSKSKTYTFELKRTMNVNIKSIYHNASVYFTLTGKSGSSYGESTSLSDLELTPDVYTLRTRSNLSSSGTTEINIKGVTLSEDPEVAYAPTSNRNYVVSVIPTKEYRLADSLYYLSRARHTISYFDDLGRPIQTVGYGASPRKQDLVSQTDYDLLGRGYRQWLPVAASRTSQYVSDYSAQSGKMYGEANAYRKLFYEETPLNRIADDYGPGADWQTTGHAVKHSYRINTAADNCRFFTVTGSRSNPVLSSKGMYAAFELDVTSITDEDGKLSLRFTDKEGRTVLERYGSGSETVDTYYVYDDFGNLCFVLSPEASALYAQNAATALDKYSYQYRYDDRNRCVGKKLPGTDWCSYIYDYADRLVFSQTGEEKKRGEWLCYLTDQVGNIVLKAVYKGTPNASSVNAGSSAVSFSTASTAFYGYVLPSFIPSSALTAIEVHYYDDYRYKQCSATAFPSALNYSSRSGYPSRYGSDADRLSCKGLETGAMVRRLGSNEWTHTSVYYDYEGRAIQIRSNEIGNRLCVRHSAYDFQGTLTASCEECPGISSFEKKYAYDHAGRLASATHLYGGQSYGFTYLYNEKGQLEGVKRMFGSSTVTTENGYNIRGWLTNIKSPAFTQNLYYMGGSNTAQCYNGNISSMTWQGSDKVMRGYKFNYDGLNRMKDATYGEGTYIGTNTNRFTEKVTSYDRNGNIKGLQRYGQTSASAYGLVDNLTFSYLNGNQLDRVDDAVAATAYNGGFEFKDAVKQAGEYAYDANGNLTKDLNKGIKQIQYNILNLPSVVTFADNSSITYTYGADGTKLRTVHKIGSATTTMDYCGNVVYEGSAAKWLLTEEGYITLSDKKYHYYLKDHQGNNRAVANQSGTVEEMNHYYPFGGVFGNIGNVQPYKYNGKELDAKKGLNWYDYGARHYDAALGRFATMDPLAEKYNSTSPYAYCGDNPVNFVDLDGRMKVIYNPDGTYKETTNNNWFHNTFAGRQEYIDYGNRKVRLSEQEFWDWQRTGNYGSIQPADGATNLEFYLEEPATGVTDGITKFVIGSGYSLINSPKVMLTGHTWSGASQTSTERVGSFIDVISSYMPISKMGKVGSPGSWYKFKKANKHIPVSKKKGIYEEKVRMYKAKTENIDLFDRMKGYGIDPLSFIYNQEEEEE